MYSKEMSKIPPYGKSSVGQQEIYLFFQVKFVPIFSSKIFSYLFKVNFRLFFQENFLPKCNAVSEILVNYCWSFDNEEIDM